MSESMGVSVSYAELPLFLKRDQIFDFYIELWRAYRAASGWAGTSRSQCSRSSRLRRRLSRLTVLASSAWLFALSADGEQGAIPLRGFYRPLHETTIRNRAAR